MAARLGAPAAAALCTLLAACAERSSPPRTGGGLAVSAAASMVRDTLRVDVTVANRGAAPREVEYGACGFRVSALPAGSGRAAWDSRRLPAGCGMQMLVLELGAGESTAPGRIRLDYPLAEVVGDSLSAGRYRVVVEAELGGRTVTVDAGEVLLRARGGPARRR